LAPLRDAPPDPGRATPPELLESPLLLESEEELESDELLDPPLLLESEDELPPDELLESPLLLESEEELESDELLDPPLLLESEDELDPEELDPPEGWRAISQTPRPWVAALSFRDAE